MTTRAAGARQLNLPLQATTFVGRREELREVKRLLTTTPLLTLIGSGGVGKTRLAVRAAADLARSFPDGVWFSPLASVQDPLLISQAIFTALGAQDRSAGWALATLTDYIGGKRLLLVLDNCEHLLDACAVMVATLMRACPGLHLLTTSRQPLGVAGEVRLAILPMAMPPGGGGVAAEAVANSEAVRLLSERAGAVLPGFVVNSANAAAVLQLCRRLDGIPLALELAAVRLGALSLDQLNEGLAGELSVLGRGNRGADARQQTLEATIGWSYGLLEGAERLLWARLSVFAGGFGADAATEVCGDGQLPSSRIVELLGALVEKSIVGRELASGNTPRYWLLETIRQFGRQRLRESGEEGLIGERHLQWIRGVARSAGAFDNRQVELFSRMDLERDNLWAAFEFCLGNPEAAPSGAALAEHLLAYWSSRGQFGDLRRVLTKLASVTPDDAAPRVHFLRAAAVMANSQNDFDARASLARESLRIATELNDVEAMATSLAWLAIPLAVMGEVAEGVAAAESALSMARQVGSVPIQLVATAVLCNIFQMTGETGRALELGEEGITLSRERGELWARSYILVATAQVHWREGRRQLAEEQARAGAAAKHALNDRAGLQLLLETLAWMAAEGGNHERAAVLLGCAGHVRRSSAIELNRGQLPQHERTVALALEGLGKLEFDAAYRSGLTMTVDDGVLVAIEDRPATRPPVARLQAKTSLTRRELEIARLIAQDLTSREIAIKLFISERTVDTHVTNMMNKLGVNSRIEIARSLRQDLAEAADAARHLSSRVTSVPNAAPGSAHQATPVPARRR